MSDRPADRIAARRSTRPMPAMTNIAVPREGQPAVKIGAKRSVERPHVLNTSVTDRTLELIDELTRRGATVAAYDPVSMAEAARVLGPRDDVSLVERAEAALQALRREINGSGNDAAWLRGIESQDRMLPEVVRRAAARWHGDQP